MFSVWAVSGGDVLWICAEANFFNAHVAAEMEQRLPHCGFFIVYDAMFVPERYVDVALAYCRMISQKLYRTQFTFTAEPVG